jgi:hypothetical protein
VGHVNERFEVLRACYNLHITSDYGDMICPKCGEKLDPCVVKVKCESFGWLMPAYQYTFEFIRWRKDERL